MASKTLLAIQTYLFLPPMSKGLYVFLHGCNFKQMRRIILLPLFFLLVGFHSNAQVFDPVKWSYDYVLDGDEHAILKFSATIEPGWHVYATKLEGEGPIPTAFDFMKLEGATLEGGIIEPPAHKEYDPNFDMELSWYETAVTFQQRVKLTESMAKVGGELTYMTCDDTKCLPPEYLEFEFDIEAAVKPQGKPAPKQEEETEPETSAAVDTESASAEETEIAGDAPEIYNPVTWRFEATKKSEDTYTIKAIATIDDEWHVYSKDLPNEDGPLPTEFNLLSGSYETVGELREIGELHTEYDPNFMMELSFYEGTMTYEQDIKVTGSELVKGEVYFMCCDAEKCLPPEAVEFTFDPATGSIVDGATAEDSESTESAEAEEVTPDAEESEEEEGKSLVAIFLLSFLGGFAALLTPCVFPMIPMTVSFFTKQSKTRAKGISNAITYGLFIIAIYTILGFLVTITFGADALNALSTNIAFNIIFFVLLVIFGISFLGAFEITLPSSFVNKVDSASDRGGLIGIFFMAFTLSLVSFSCTGPIIGTLLVEAAVNGGVAGPLVGMGGFSLALALPFGLFAAFPGWMNTLPKSGGWLNSVKVVLGFLEIGLAFKFLSNADLVAQSGWIQREVFIAIWIAVSAMITLYLLGFITMPHDSPLERLSVTRALLGTTFLMFTIYLIPGLWGAPLKLISGFPPPMFYSEAPTGFGGGGGSAAHAGPSDNSGIPDGADPAHCPHGLNCFHDYEKGLAYAKQVDKPILLDFTGWACVNCRKMEEQVWSDPRVLKLLNDEVVLISLYVDEKTELPEDEKYVSEETGKKVKTVGNKWADFQIKHFKSNAQPQYVIINHEEIKALNGTTAYDPDIPLYVNWLEEGIETFEKQK